MQALRRRCVSGRPASILTALPDTPPLRSQGTTTLTRKVATGGRQTKERETGRAASVYTATKEASAHRTGIAQLLCLQRGRRGAQGPGCGDCALETGCEEAAGLPRTRWVGDKCARNWGNKATARRSGGTFSRHRATEGLPDGATKTGPPPREDVRCPGRRPAARPRGRVTIREQRNAGSHSGTGLPPCGASVSEAAARIPHLARLHVRSETAGPWRAGTTRAQPSPGGRNGNRNRSPCCCGPRRRRTRRRAPPPPLGPSRHCCPACGTGRALREGSGAKVGPQNSDRPGPPGGAGRELTCCPRVVKPSELQLQHLGSTSVLLTFTVTISLVIS